MRISSVNQFTFHPCELPFEAFNLRRCDAYCFHFGGGIFGNLASEFRGIGDEEREVVGLLKNVGSYICVYIRGGRKRKLFRRESLDETGTRGNFCI